MIRGGAVAAKCFWLLYLSESRLVKGLVGAISLEAVSVAVRLNCEKAALTTKTVQKTKKKIFLITSHSLCM